MGYDSDKHLYKLNNLVSPCIRLLSPSALCIVPKWTMDSIAPSKNNYLVVEGNPGTHSTILLHKCLCFSPAIVANDRLYALQTRSNLCVSRNETAQPRSHFPYSRICDRSWENINGSQIHEWERGREVSFLGIFVSTFRYSVFLCSVGLTQHA
jgi:hypothetical protein